MTPARFAMIALALMHSPATAQVSIGNPAPAITLEHLLQTPPGVPAAHDLGWADLKGNVVILEFWATWCGPCISQIPHLNALAEEFKDKPVRFISITKEDEPTVAKFLAKRPINAWIGLDTDGSMHKAYGVRGIPHTAIVDQRGNFLGVTLPEDLNAELLNKILAGQPPKLADGSHRGSPRTVEELEQSERATATKLPPPVFQLVLRRSESKHGLIDQGPGHFHADGIRLSAIARVAYASEDFEHQLTSQGIGDDTYMIAATMPPGREDALEPALRSLLRDAFGISARVEERMIEVAILTTPNGPGPGIQRSIAGRGSARMGSGLLHIRGTDRSSIVASVAGTLEMPIIDRTSLDEGEYDFKVEWDPQDPASKREAFLRASGITYTTESRLMRVLVVDRD